MTSQTIADYRDTRLRTVSAGTVLLEIGRLSAIFETARRESKLIQQNPTADIRKPRAPDHRDVVITGKQIKLMLREMDYAPNRPIRSITQSVAVIFMAALRTGMRAGELCGLTWDRVFDDYCSTPHKTGRLETSLREVPITAKAQRLINKMQRFAPPTAYTKSLPQKSGRLTKDSQALHSRNRGDACFHAEGYLTANPQKPA